MKKFVFDSFGMQKFLELMTIMHHKRLIFNSMDYEIHVICDPNKKEEGDEREVEH